MPLLVALHFAPAAHTRLLNMTDAHGWPMPGGGVQVPAVPPDAAATQIRSPVQPTTGLADRSQGCPWPACTTVLPSVHMCVTGWQKLPFWHAADAHDPPTGTPPARQVEHASPAPHDPLTHWLE